MPRELELAMEESLDQDTEIAVPVPDGADYVSRDHEAYARSLVEGSVCSLPLRPKGEDVCAIVTLERDTAFSAAEIELARLAGEAR